MIWLLDGNVLIALTTADHVDHERAHRWFSAQPRRFATCPITQGTLLRFYLRLSKDKSAHAAWGVLHGVTTSASHEFWPDDVGYDAVECGNVIGHAQVTDAYLAALARRRKGRLATLDHGLSEAHRDVATLLPEAPP